MPSITFVSSFVIGIDTTLCPWSNLRHRWPGIAGGQGRWAALAVEELAFRNGTVFDGSQFLPAGTGVRIREGKITEVGPLGPPSGADPVDLHGGTILPGFIDAHAHPVFAGDQLRRRDLAGADTGFGTDLAIVNADLAHLPAPEICQAMVTQTWIRGQAVYQQH